MVEGLMLIGKHHYVVLEQSRLTKEIKWVQYVISRRTTEDKI
jgi:hypothetical protein